MTRRRWRIVGQVQGVGFRPFVYRLARAHGLVGRILNDSTGVVIEAQGGALAMERFAQDLVSQRPALAVISHIETQDVVPVSGEHEFRIEHSEDDHRPRADVTVDSALCGACRGELLSADDRRRGYGLINCTDCGPRYSIIRRVPYDRPNTTMAQFQMCPACAGEYADPSDRRFHAQPIACHDCGPKVALVDSRGRPIDGDPIEQTAKCLEQGQIVAIKGLGGFHLAVRADGEAAVARLRSLKKRDGKPFALMCGSADQAQRVVELSEQGRKAIESPAAPVVLAKRRAGAPVAASVAPDNHRLGVMLPYTPIHHLLFGALGTDAPALVMTSGNLSDEPLAIDNAEALQRLGGMCDAILWHDRPIERCVDDSVIIDVGDAPLPIRRSRGYAPMSIALPADAGVPGLCVGGELKNTVAVVRDGSAILSQHLGDLNHPLALEYFRKAVADLRELFGVRPSWIAHDLHPLYQSHGYAKQLAGELGAELIGVQHHHAHPCGGV